MDMHTEQTPPPPAPSSPTPAPSSPSPVAVLVVDDSTVLRTMLCSLLRLEGYTVFEAPDGMSALDRLRSHAAPMVVLLDWWMPRMDGVQVLQALAADEAAVQPHIIFVLTAADHEFRRWLSRDGAAIPSHLAVSVLGKPFDVDVLLTVVAGAAAHIAQDT
jgi:two-component system response regulator (stage 0 sporulation protein F)